MTPLRLYDSESGLEIRGYIVHRTICCAWSGSFNLFLAWIREESNDSASRVSSRDGRACYRNAAGYDLSTSSAFRFLLFLLKIYFFFFCRVQLFAISCDNILVVLHTCKLWFRGMYRTMLCDHCAIRYRNNSVSLFSLRFIDFSVAKGRSRVSRTSCISCKKRWLSSANIYRYRYSFARISAGCWVRVNRKVITTFCRLNQEVNVL